MATIAPPLLQRKREPDEQQLLKLFWNRAELKKELGKLRREKDKLVDQLRQQEAVNLRAQQRLEQLENLLGDPLQALNAVIYYQLRGVWQLCRKRLARVGKDLSERQQDREEKHAMQHFEQARDREVAAVDARIAETDRRAQVIAGDLQAAQERLRQLRGFWNYFRRRAVHDQVAAIQAALDGLTAQMSRLGEERRLKMSEPASPFAGVSIEGKRHINIAVIALAQELIIHFSAHNVAALAREASVRALADVAYGDVGLCQNLGRNIEALVRSLPSVDRMTADIRRRADALRKAAQYRREADTVPVAGSFASIALQPGEAPGGNAGKGGAIPVNVLADEYWDIYAALLS